MRVSHHALNGLVTRQLLWVLIGTIIMVGALFFDYRAMVTYAYPIYVASLALLIAVAVIGHSTGGSRRWINLGFFHLEPSELAKLAIVLVMVRYLREEPPRGGWRLHQMIIPGLMLGVPAALVLKQPDLGTALVLILISVTLVFVSGLNWRTMVALGLAAMLAAPVSWHYLKPYQRQRLVSFIDPKADPLGSGYHIIQSEIAIGAGGTWGKGFMKGTQARLNFLPEETTDFIFRGVRRGIRHRGLDPAARALCESDCARHLDRAACARSLRRAARARADRHRVLAGRDQHRDDDRDAAGGRHPAAAGQLWRLLGAHDDDGDGLADQRQRAPPHLLTLASCLAPWRR